ncbi:MAG: DUF2332 domain-containing protein [Actinobacteria bacterium]|uniref:DUF2332 domain-containing protein n=1 Tax=Nostocoides veronense TaxID=330836 RepID=A0ABP4XYB3_9MICO|nr:DUF2332 domain-containing protein [Actinomycetota bacterium]
MSSLAEQFRRHFDHREHLYGVLLAELADDLEAGGPTAQICRDALGATRADAVHLRLLAGIFRIVLRGDAPQLRPFYPCLGGTEPAEKCWPVLRSVLPEYAEELRESLTLPPQTNEVGRSAALAVGLFEAIRHHGIHRVRLLEPGASAGLNLNVARYRFTGPGWAAGPADSQLALETEAVGIRPQPFEVVSRRGCDLAPVDIATVEGRDYLTSFVWPWQVDRHARLSAAFGIAAEHPVPVDRAPASRWIADQLSRPAETDVLTVVWESITRQYWPSEESTAVDAAIAQARERIPLAHITLEGLPPTQGTDGYAVVTHGPQLLVDGRLVARTHHHGIPIVPL